MVAMAPAPVIHALHVDDLGALVAYLDDQGKENGRDGGTLFQPYSRQTGRSTADVLDVFRAGMGTSVGAPNWRRGWTARDEHGAIIGHVDLRARPDPSTAHRCLLGLGVHRAHRRQGVGDALIQHAIAWAISQTELEWIDLSVLGGNTAARRLYQRTGFVQVATVIDMFRVDGESVDDILMTRRIRA
jgi:ribosomal protein S18 acetylase RimI-like enzyme